jgi:hypothetical protein
MTLVLHKGGIFAFMENAEFKSKLFILISVNIKYLGVYSQKTKVIKFNICV